MYSAPDYWLLAPEAGRTVVLADGARAVVRRLAGGEVAAIQQIFEGMSEASRYHRFMGAKPRLSPSDLELLTAIGDDNHEALIALDPATGDAIGEARLVRDQANRGVADVAFAVADAWQDRCLGARLADLVARRARELGIQRLRAQMMADNSRSGALMRRMGRIVGRKYEGATIELEVALD